MATFKFDIENSKAIRRLKKLVSEVRNLKREAQVAEEALDELERPRRRGGGGGRRGRQSLKSKES